MRRSILNVPATAAAACSFNNKHHSKAFLHMLIQQRVFPSDGQYNICAASFPSEELTILKCIRRGRACHHR